MGWGARAGFWGQVTSENSLKEKYSFFSKDGLSEDILTGGDRIYKAQLCKMARIVCVCVLGGGVGK